MRLIKLLAAALLLPALSSAQVKISNLPGAPSLTGSESIPCSVGTSATYKCTPTALHDFIHTNYVDLCKQSGIDATGATDSDAAVQTQFAAIAGSGQTLYVNCPIKLSIVQDATKVVFVGDNTNVRFGPQGVFIVDNQYIS